MTRHLVSGSRLNGRGDVVLTVEERPSWLARVFLRRLPFFRVYQGSSKRWRSLPDYRPVLDHEVLYQLRGLEQEWAACERAGRSA